MNVLVISDDSFFSLGVSSYLKQECTVFLIDVNSDFDLSELRELVPWRVEFIFVSLSSTVKFMEVMYAINSFMARLVIFSGSRHCHGTQAISHYRCASKRIAIEQFHELLTSAKHIQQQNVTLTQREESVLLFILQGLSNTRISTKMGISVKTVSAHKLNALRKFGLKKINQFGDFSMRYHERLQPPSIARP